MEIKNRVQGLRYIRARDLAPHPKNWRTHPEQQRQALNGLLQSIGIADALLVRPLRDGYQIIDGHCRAEEAPEAKWPCLVLDLSDEETDTYLALHDPVAAMAEADAQALAGLVADVPPQPDSLQALLAALKTEATSSLLDIASEHFEHKGHDPSSVLVGLHFALDRERAAQVTARLREHAGDQVKGPSVQWQSEALYDLLVGPSDSLGGPD